MLGRSTKYLEQALNKVRDRLDDLVQVETCDLILSWNKRFPLYQFKIDNYDLCELYYKEAGDNDSPWEEVNIYKPVAYNDDLRIVIDEFDKFTDALYALEQSISPANFGEIM